MLDGKIIYIMLVIANVVTLRLKYLYSLIDNRILCDNFVSLGNENKALEEVFFWKKISIDSLNICFLELSLFRLLFQ